MRQRGGRTSRDAGVRIRSRKFRWGVGWEPNRPRFARLATPRDDDSHQSTLAPGVHRTSRVAVPRLVAAEASYEPRKRGTHILCFVLEKTVDDELK